MLFKQQIINLRFQNQFLILRKTFSEKVCKTSLFLIFSWIRAPKLHCFCQKSFELFLSTDLLGGRKNKETFSKKFFFRFVFSNPIFNFQSDIQRESLWKSQFCNFSTKLERKKFHWFRQHKFDLYFSTDIVGEKNWKQTLRKKLFSGLFSKLIRISSQEYIWAQILNDKIGKLIFV